VNAARASRSARGIEDRTDQSRETRIGELRVDALQRVQEPARFAPGAGSRARGAVPITNASRAQLQARRGLRSAVVEP
jgi:hypothetical protein